MEEGQAFLNLIKLKGRHLIIGFRYARQADGCVFLMPPSRLHYNFNVLAEGIEEPEEFICRKPAKLPADQG